MTTNEILQPIIANLIILADDDPADCHLFQEALSDCPFCETTIVNNGED